MREGVIQIIDSLNTGGAEVLAVNIANSLSKKNVNSYICATRQEGKLLTSIDANTGYLFLNRRKKIDFKSLFLFKNYLKTKNITILHAHATSFFFAFCVKLIYPKIRVIYHIHQGKIVNSGSLKIVLLKIVSLFFESIIVVNKEIKEWVMLKLFCKNVYFFNNFPLFNNLNKQTFLKGLSNKRIVHLAGFKEAKDHKTLINAFDLFVKRNKDWSLHLVGSIKKDNYSKEILSLIKQKKLQNSIFTYGSCLDIKYILQQADIGVLSSKSEGLPVSLLEYGLARLPVVITEVGECASVVENDVTGFLVEPVNPVELSNNLELLVKSKEKRINFGLALYQKVQKEYSKEKFINQLLKIYKI